MFYLRLAFANLRAHKRIFLPFCLAMGLLTMMNVVMLAVHQDASQIFAAGGAGTQAAATEIFKYGSNVMIIFAVALGWYANGFLLKQRTRQLALYAVIGFGRRELRRMVFAELACCWLVATFGGELLGVVFARLSYLILGPQFTIQVQHPDD